jgi:hypothetical protein
MVWTGSNWLRKAPVNTVMNLRVLDELHNWQFLNKGSVS